MLFKNITLCCLLPGYISHIQHSQNPCNRGREGKTTFPFSPSWLLGGLGAPVSLGQAQNQWQWSAVTQSHCHAHSSFTEWTPRGLKGRMPCPLQRQGVSCLFIWGSKNTLPGFSAVAPHFPPERIFFIEGLWVASTTCLPCKGGTET